MVKKMATALSVIHQEDGYIFHETLEEVILMHCLCMFLIFFFPILLDLYYIAFPKDNIPQSGPLTKE